MQVISIFARKILFFLKDDFFTLFKYLIIAIVVVFLIFFSYKLYGIYRKYNDVFDKNIYLQKSVMELEFTSKNQEQTIKNYKKIFQKEVFLKSQSEKIKIDRNKLLTQKIGEINTLINCHIDNIENLEITCND